MTNDTVRVMVASHSHVNISKGGAEVAAYELYRHLLTLPRFDATLLACSRDQFVGRLGSPITQPFSASEYVYSAGDFDWFNFANRDRQFPAALAELLKRTSPQILHFHHYILFGVEVFLHIKRALPNSVIVLTLHEYLAICNNQGQMIKSEHGLLCQKASALDCARCFPDRSPGDFFLRHRYIKRFFDLVDHFIAPSRFLASRYIEWGLPANKISVIENVIRPRPRPPTASRWSRPITKSPLRVGFFGQISRLKGIDVLLDAAELLAKMGCHDVIFEISGDYGQSGDFGAHFRDRLANCSSNVRYLGPYNNDKVDELMDQVDVVAMPSIWWENSPVVIQEALRNRKPIICSDIGGMVEKVIDGETGFHFPAGSSTRLAHLLRDLATDRTRLKKITSKLAKIQLPDALRAHVELYKRLMHGRVPLRQMPWITPDGR